MTKNHADIRTDYVKTKSLEKQTKKSRWNPLRYGFYFYLYYYYYYSCHMLVVKCAQASTQFGLHLQFVPRVKKKFMCVLFF